ncbi:MAG TPA: phage tail protein [Longimicrobium sp.]|nr:phage tail protein [Longimicrobium sp.]
MNTLTLPVLLAAGALALGAVPTRAQQCGSPVGTVIAFAGENVPPNWMLADGRPLSSVDYPELAAAIRTAHGAGYDESGTNKIGDFNLPDLRGRFLRGVDASESGARNGLDRDDERTRARTGGNARGVGSVQDDATRLPRIPFTTNSVPAHGGHTSGNGGGVAFGNNTMGVHNFGLYEAGGHGHRVDAGGDRETRPVNVAVKWLICVR